MWEELGLEVEVALYCRNLAKAEKPDSTTAIGTLVRQQQEALGLSLPGLARLHWTIDTGLTTQSKVTRADDQDRSGAKARFRTLEGGVAS